MNAINIKDDEIKTKTITYKRSRQIEDEIIRNWPMFSMDTDNKGHDTD